eukprot:Sspe_Gene.97163::Locus_70801_Transcript_1_1_Confidence_1.000_Length_390::g.97163::m.97163
MSILQLPPEVKYVGGVIQSGTVVKEVSHGKDLARIADVGVIRHCFLEGDSVEEGKMVFFYVLPREPSPVGIHGPGVVGESLEAAAQKLVRAVAAEQQKWWAVKS